MRWVAYCLVAFGAIFIIVTIISLVRTAERLAAPGPFQVQREMATQGITDPTLAFDNTGDNGYVAYAAVSGPDAGGQYPPVSVHLGHSQNQGDRWVFAGPVFSARPDELVRNGNQPVSGIWRYEMPTLVYTPEDVGREWKIYAYRYFWADNIELARRTGVIVYKDSSDPRQGWSEEKWFFSANQYNPPAPYNQLVLMHLNVLDPSLSDVIAYSDPGAHVRDGVLYVTLAAFEEIQNPARVVIVASRDFGQSWVYLGNVLTRNDLALLGYTRMAGGQIVEHEGESYFLVALGDELQNAQGTFVFKFADLAAGELERDREGKPVLYRHFELNERVTTLFGGGQADYHEMNEAGLLMPIMLPRATQSFVIEGRGHGLTQ